MLREPKNILPVLFFNLTELIDNSESMAMFTFSLRIFQKSKEEALSLHYCPMRGHDAREVDI